MRTAPLFFIALACLHLAACTDEPASQAIGVGQWSDRTYTHEYFDISATFPEDWDIMERDEMESAMNLTGEVMADGAGMSDSQMDASMNNTVGLFMVTKGGYNVMDGADQAITCLAERVKNHPDAKTGKDYNETIMEMYRQMNMPVTWSSDRDDTIGGVTFNVRPMSFNTPKGKVLMELYAAKIDDYMLVISVNASSQTKLDEAKAILNEMSFEEGVEF